MRFGYRLAKCTSKVFRMSDLVHDVQQDFWRPPLAKPSVETGLAEACRRCGTEFMVGAAFCHICGLGRHRAANAPNGWTKHLHFPHALEFSTIKRWFGLPLAPLCAFLVGVAFIVVGLCMGFMSVHDYTDFEAIQLWRIEWLMAACAAFLAGILLKGRKPEGN